MSVGEGAHGDAPDTNKSVFPKYKPTHQTTDTVLKSLWFDQDNFRKTFCLDCRHHKVEYICMKCRIDMIDDVRAFLTIRGQYVGEVSLSGGLKK